jgi:hypothetical protein
VIAVSHGLTVESIPAGSSPMCPPCSRAWLAWLDWRLPPAPVQLISIGNRVREASDRREGRYRQWRDTVRFQQGLIRSRCTGNCEAGEAS